MARLVLWISLITIIFSSAGCRGGGSSSSDPIVLSPEIANLVQGSTLTLSVIQNGAKTRAGGFIWQSSDFSIATVDANGVVTGVKVGVVTITATSGKISGTATVGVISPNKGLPGLSLSGTGFYEDKPFDQNGFTGTITKKPIRNAVVEAVAIDGFAVIGRGVTNDFGEIMISALDNSSRRGGVYLRVISRTLEGHNTKIELRNNPSSQSFLSVISAAVDDSVVNSAVRDILATATGIGGAFNILDALSVASEFVQGQTACAPKPDCIPPLVTAYWEPGNTVGTFYDGQSAIFILGGGKGDTDEYDDSVIIHEYGHFVLNKFSHDDSQGGVHGLTENDQDIRLSWSEGWANFFSSAVRGESFYVDTAPSGLLLSFDLENYSSPQATSLSANAIYTTSEVAVAGVLWDIFDGLSAGESDPLWLGFGPIWQTLLNIPPRPTRSTMERFWLAFEAAQPASTADFQTIMTGRQIKLFADGFEGAEVTLGLGDTSKGHTLYLSGDTDIFSFIAEQGKIYTVKTFNLNNGADTLLEIRDSGGNFIDSNDNPGKAIFSNCTISPFGISNCPRNGPTNLAASVTFTWTGAKGAKETLRAHVSHSSVAPPSAGLFGAYDMTLTSP